MRSSDKDLWECAQHEELTSLRADHTWRVVKTEPGVPRLHNKWVYKKKRTCDGKTERYRAILVACGNEQVLGVNLLLTFAAGLDMTSAKAILSIAYILHTPAGHFDVPSAYVRTAKEDDVDIKIYILDGIYFTLKGLSEYGVDTM